MDLARILSAGFLSVALSHPLAATPVHHQYEGKLGENRIGLTVIRTGNRIQGGHYFYQKFLKDIPLTGSFDGSQITLDEMGTGTFRLHFVGSGSNGGRPLDFGNSVGMEGVWVSLDGARSYPVSLGGTTIWQGAEGERRYSGVTNESDAAFEQRVQSFYLAALRGDKATASRFIHYPLHVNFANGAKKTFRNSAQLLAAWNDVFTPLLLKKLEDALPHDMSIHRDGVMLGNGEAWFDARGLTALNVP